MLTPEQLVALAPRLLAPPLEQWNDGMVANLPGARGVFGGRWATLRVVQLGKAAPGAASSSLCVEIEGPTHGAILSVSTPAVCRNEPLTGDPEFDARYEVYAVPRAIGPLVCGPEVRAQLKVARPGFLRMEDDRVRINTTSRPQALEAMAAQLAVAAMMLDRVPDAMRAAGGPAHAGGAPHPEVVQHARNRRLVRTLLVVGLALIIVVPLLVVGVAGGIFYLTSEPEATAAVTSADLDLLRPGAQTTFEARPGQRLGFRATIDLDPRLGASKSSKRQASDNVRASKLAVTVAGPDGPSRVLSCPLTGSASMLSTNRSFRFSGLRLGCAYVAEQAGTHRVMATPQWRGLSPTGASLKVVASGGP